MARTSITFTSDELLTLVTVLDEFLEERDAFEWPKTRNLLGKLRKRWDALDAKERAEDVF